MYFFFTFSDLFPLAFFFFFNSCCTLSNFCVFFSFLHLLDSLYINQFPLPLLFFLSEKYTVYSVVCFFTSIPRILSCVQKQFILIMTILPIFERCVLCPSCHFYSLLYIVVNCCICNELKLLISDWTSKFITELQMNYGLLKAE